jgi:hypothetical protein
MLSLSRSSCSFLIWSIRSVCASRARRASTSCRRAVFSFVRPAGTGAGAEEEEGEEEEEEEGATRQKDSVSSLPGGKSDT